MKIKFILPSLIESGSPLWRPIKYSLFPPLGLATLAGFLSPDDEAEIVDQHVQRLMVDDAPDVVAIQVYITNAYRAYEIADHYRTKGVFVILGGVHVTSLPEEAEQHADAVFLGPFRVLRAPPEHLAVPRLARSRIGHRTEGTVHFSVDLRYGVAQCHGMSRTARNGTPTYQFPPRLTCAVCPY